MTDFLESLQHSWGKSPKQKAREKEYNAEYYRKHKDWWSTKYGPKPINGVSQSQYENEDAYNKRYYNSKDSQGKWAIAPKKTKKTPGYQDVGKYVDDNIRYQREIGEDNRRLKIKESGMSWDDEKKYMKRYTSARQMADNERDKLIKQYEANERTYTRANDVKLAKAKVRKVAKEFKSNWKIGAAAISDSAKKGADFVKNLFK